MIKDNEAFLAYASVCGQVPMMHKVLIGNPILLRLMSPMETWNQVLVFTMKAMNGRASMARDRGASKADIEGPDLMSRWTTDTQDLNILELVIHLSTNIFAGSDTTAIALRAVIYFLCRHHECLERLVHEIDTADQRGSLSHPITYKEATAGMPYLGAVIREAMRLFSPVGLPLEREVPAEGLQVLGYHIPAGTIVGINPWVTNRSSAFGPDPEKFNPDRWLTASESQIHRMENIWELNFGGGSRKCLGRNVAMIEIHKVIPELLRQYRVRLTHPEKEWRTSNYWFVQQKGLICSLTMRR